MEFPVGVPRVHWKYISTFESKRESCSGRGICECSEDDPNAEAKCVCEDGYSGAFCHYESTARFDPYTGNLVTDEILDDKSSISQELFFCN